MEIKIFKIRSDVINVQQLIITYYHDHRSLQPRDTAPVAQLLLKVGLRSFVLLEVLLLLRSGPWPRLRLLAHITCKP